MSRAVAIWALLVVVLTALSSSPSASHGVVGPAVAVSLAGIIGFAITVGARTSVVLAGLRRGRILIDDHHGLHRHLPASVLGVVVGLMCAAAAVLVGMLWPMRPFVVVAVAGVVAIVAAVVWPMPVALKSRDRSPWPWLLEGALQAAGVAACIGGVVAVARFGGVDVVKPGELSRTMAGTLLCDGLLGVGGFARAAVERSRGLVRVPSVILPSAPGPVMVALGLAALTILVGPELLPTLSGTSAVVLKVVVGAVVGGALHLCGGLRGVQMSVVPGSAA